MISLCDESKLLSEITNQFIGFSPFIYQYVLLEIFMQGLGELFGIFLKVSIFINEPQRSQCGLGCLRRKYM
jgi:hypothetical protein